MSEFVSGYRHDLENIAELKATAKPFACAAAADMPEEIDARPWITTENQGQVSSCFGHASSTVGEHCNWVKTGEKTQLSRMFCYLMGQKRAGLFGSDQGCFIGPGVESAKQDGYCKEETFKYPGRYVTSIPGEAVTEGKRHLMGAHVVHNSLEEMIQFAGRGIGGTIAGIPWYESFANCNSPVIYELGGQFYGWHAIAFIGYDSQKRPRLFNSHGTGWGENGSAVVDRSVMERLFRTDGAIFIGVSDLQEFGDRKVPTWKGKLFG